MSTTFKSSMVDKHKKAFKAARKGAKTDKKKKDEKPNTGKWAPPATNENNRRTIDGVARYWLSNSKRWIKDKQIVGTAAVAVAATPVPTTIVPSSAISTVSTTDVTTASRELAVANAAHSIQLAMQGLLNTLQN
jgi:hypothetical protein